MSEQKEVSAVFYVDIERAKEVVDLFDFDPSEVRSVKFLSYGEQLAFAEVTVLREIPFGDFIEIVKGGVK